MSNFTRFSSNSYSVMKRSRKGIRLFKRTNVRSRPVNRAGNFRLLSLLDKPLRLVAIALIGGYQRYLSPRKGYSCAHRIVYGGLSCSEYVKNTLSNTNMFESALLAGQRFRACRRAYISSKHRAIGPGDIDPEWIAQCCAALGAIIACGVCRNNRR